jgi:DNA gyrase subunit B
VVVKLHLDGSVTVTDIDREGHSWTQTYRLGKPDSDMAQGAPTRETGTRIRFWPDKSVFTENNEFDFEILTSRLRELSFLNRETYTRPAYLE